MIAQTLTRTFWNSAPEREFSVEVPASRPNIRVQAPRPAPASQKRSAAATPGLLRGTAASSAVQPAGTAAFGSRNRLLTAPSTQPGPNPGLIGAPSAATASAPTVVTIPSGSTTAPPSANGRQGETGGRSLRQVPFGSRSLSRSPGSLESRSTNLPPPGPNDATKRQLDPNAPTPPVRSSMPGQRNQ